MAWEATKTRRGFLSVLNVRENDRFTGTIVFHGSCGYSSRLIRASDLSYHFGRCEVEHDHELFLAPIADLLLSYDPRDSVQELRRIGVSPLKIQLARQARGVQLSSLQIHNICRPAC
jgi:hypothetical protein